MTVPAGSNNRRERYENDAPAEKYRNRGCHLLTPASRAIPQTGEPFSSGNFLGRRHDVPCIDDDECERSSIVACRRENGTASVTSGLLQPFPGEWGDRVTPPLDRQGCRVPGSIVSTTTLAGRAGHWSGVDGNMPAHRRATPLRESRTINTMAQSVKHPM